LTTGGLDGPAAVFVAADFVLGFGAAFGFASVFGFVCDFGFGFAEGFFAGGFEPLDSLAFCFVSLSSAIA
jgi:hypothetical protein